MSELIIERDELLDRLNGLSLSYSMSMGFPADDTFIDGLNDLEAQVRKLDERIDAITEKNPSNSCKEKEGEV